MSVIFRLPINICIIVGIRLAMLTAWVIRVTAVRCTGESPGDLTVILAQFWAKVDAALDTLEEAARREMQKPVSSRNKSLASLAELTQVLKHDPYK